MKAAQNSNQTLQTDCDKLQLLLTSAQREKDHQREEKEAAILERDRAKAEVQRM